MRRKILNPNNCAWKPSLRRILPFKPHLESHSNRKFILDRLQILVQANDELTCPDDLNPNKARKRYNGINHLTNQSWG
uniref:Auxin response factor n=1 Tax=Rhizophora mucronata TaxID=61149 RepID=A0A2P2MAM1_RHIMU